MSRPEWTGHASSFYNATEAQKYDSSSRMIRVQREITTRALELLRLPSDDTNTMQYVLDIGCGSGLSGQVLEEAGHVWVGCDISRDMLSVAKERQLEQQQQQQQQQQQLDKDSNMKDDEDFEDEEEEDEEDSSFPLGDLLHHDMGTGLPFRDGTFDAVISISAIQWLCYSNSKSQIPKRRMTRFFSSLYSVLKPTGRAVLQWYPETAEQAILMSECATSVGFSGGMVVDYPNSAKAKKHYLVLSHTGGAAAGGGTKHNTTANEAPTTRSVSVIGTTTTSSTSTKKQQQKKGLVVRKKKGNIKTKEWILHKKERQRKQGKAVRPDTKYTARRRPQKF